MYWGSLFILEKVKAQELEPSERPDLFAYSPLVAQSGTALEESVLIFPPSAKAFLKPIQMYLKALPWQRTNPLKCICHYTAFSHDYATLGFGLEEAT